MPKKCCYVRGRTWVNIAVCPCLHSFLTHNKHQLFENKVWEIYIFIRSVFVCYWSRHYWLMMFPHISVYLCIYIYTCSCMRLYNSNDKQAGLWYRSPRVRTPVVLLRLLSAFGKGMNTLISQWWVKSYHYYRSTRMSLALNNLRRFICHWIKRPKQIHFFLSNRRVSQPLFWRKLQLINFNFVKCIVGRWKDLLDG